MGSGHKTLGGTIIYKTPITRKEIIKENNEPSVNVKHILRCVLHFISTTAV